MSVKMYSTHCPKCIILGKKLSQKGIEFEEVTDIEEMQSLGIMSVPVLEVEGKLLEFSKAVKWINEV